MMLTPLDLFSHCGLKIPRQFSIPPVPFLLKQSLLENKP